MDDDTVWGNLKKTVIIVVDAFFFFSLSFSLYSYFMCLKWS